MASKELLSISEQKKDLNSKLSTRTIRDLKRTTSDTYKTADKYFIEYAEVTSNSTSFGIEHILRINRSDGFVGEYFLEIVLGSPGTLDVGKMGIYNMIDSYEIELSGRPSIRFTGNTLSQFLQSINTEKDSRDLIRDISGGTNGAGGDIQGETIIAPIVGPGSSGVLKSYGDMGQSPLWPISKMAADMIIKIKLKTQAECDVNGIITMSSLKIKYKRAVSKSDTGIAKTSTGKTVIYSYNYIYVQDTNVIATQVSGTEYSYDLSNIITEGELQWIGVNQVIDANYSSAKENFISQEITTLKFLIKGNIEVYKHVSTREAIYKHMKDFKHLNQFNHATTPTYYYNIPICANYNWVVKNPGAYGVNLNLETPVLKITAPASDTVKLSTFAVFKCTYNLYSDRTGKEVLVI